MSEAKQEAVVSLALLAALADRTLATEERAVLEDMMQELTEEQRRGLLFKALGGSLVIDDLVEEIQTEMPQSDIYDMAVRICQSDGKVTKREVMFLSRLRLVLAFSAVISKRRSAA